MTRLPRSPILALLLAGSLALVSSCASNGHQSGSFPPSADLAVEEKPKLDPAVLARCHEAGIDPAECSDAALTAHEDRIESWGERGWDAVARLCRFHKATGMPGLTCPRPREPG